MSLTPVFSTIINPYGPKSTSWYAELIHPDWIYSEKLSAIYAFYYNESSDCYHLVVLFSTSYYPSWAYVNLMFSAADGSYQGREAGMTSDVFTAMTLAWAQWLGPGLNNVFYMCSSYTLNTVNLDDLRASGEYTSDIRTWNPAVPIGAGPWMINRFDDVIGVCTGGGLRIYNSIASVPNMIGELVLPSVSITGFCFEDRQRCWLVASSGVLLKVNYTLRRWEVMTAIDTPAPGTKTLKVAYDTKRKNVGIFSWMPDDADGTCKSTITVYRPIYKAYGLTDPVPVQKIVAGTNVKFISHLHGNAGEGVAATTAGVEVLAPALGRTPSGSALVELNGAIQMKYIAPVLPGTDTIAVSVEGV